MKKIQNNKKIIEIKRYIDKPSQFFECDFIETKNKLILTKYHLPKNNIFFSQDVVSYGFFWFDKNFISYSFYNVKDMSYIASRYDICSEVHFQETPFLLVSFLDLYLDYWIIDGNNFWEDDKELKTAQDKGIISEVQIKTIETTKIEINNNILKLEKIKEKVILNLDWTV